MRKEGSWRWIGKRQRGAVDSIATTAEPVVVSVAFAGDTAEEILALFSKKGLLLRKSEG